MYSKKGNAIIIILVLVVVLGLAALLLARKSVSRNYQNSSYQVTGNSSNASLDKDMNAIDASLGNSNTAANGVNQGLSDTPIAQPQ